MDVKYLVEKYHQKVLFVFLPNICNSACDFCYVHPLVGEKAKLNKNAISNFKKLVIQAKQLGFDTIRITGGEPLIFSNLDDIIKILKDEKLKYTILTNGQTLEDYKKLFKNYHPKKISISYHSEEKYIQIFKRKIDEELLLSNISFLKKLDVEISITIVYLEENKNEILYLVDKFKKLKVDEIKFILANIPSTNEKTIKEFESINIKASNTKIRITDTEQVKCLLKERSFLSIVVQDLKAYDCCTNVGNSKYKSLKDFSLEQIVYHP